MIRALDDSLHSLSKWGVVLCVAFMLLLTLTNIILRWFQFSVHWLDPLVRHLVFLAAFFGGSLATGSRHHIKIDILPRFIEKSGNRNYQIWLDRFVTSVTLISTVLLGKAAIDLVLVEAQYGKTVFWGIHSSYLIGIIPVGMILISLRLAFRFLLTFKTPSRD